MATKTGPFVTPLIVNGKSYDNLEDAQLDVLMPSGRLVKLDGYAGAGGLIAPGAPGMAKALWVGTAGAITAKDAYGNVLTAFPLLAGLNLFMLSELTTLTSASNIWGMY